MMIQIVVLVSFSKLRFCVYMITLNPRSALTSEKKLGTSRVKKGKKKEKKKKSHLLALKTMKYKEGNTFFKIILYLFHF